MKTVIIFLLAMLCGSVQAANIGSTQAKVPYDTSTGVGTWPVTIGSGSAANAVSLTAVSAGVSITVNNTEASAVPVGLTGAAYAGVTAGSGVLDVQRGATSTAAPYFNKLIGVNGTGIATAANAVPVAGSITNTVDINGVDGATVATNANPVPVTATSWTKSVQWVLLTSTALTGLTTNANTTVNVTHTAGSAAYSAYKLVVSIETGVTSMRVTSHNGTTVSTGFGASNGPTYFPGDTPKTVSIFNYPMNSSPHFTARASALSGATSGSMWYEVWGQP